MNASRAGGTHRSRMLTETALTLGAIAGLVCIVGAIVAIAFGIRPLIVRSGSMEPAMPVGSLVLATQVDATSLHTGDIVSVIADDGSPITHRVVGIEAATADTVALQMKGDANTSPDAAPYMVSTGDRVFVTVPAAGYVASWLATPPAWILGALAALGLGYLAFRPERPRTTGRDKTPAGSAVVATAAIAVTIVVAGVQIRDTAAAFADTATTTSTFTTSAANFVVDPPAITCTDDAPSQQARLSWEAAPVGYSYRIDFFRGATFIRTVSVGSGASYTPTAADAPAINPFEATTYSARLYTVRTETGAASSGYQSHDINSTLTCGSAQPPATPASIASFAVLAGAGITNVGATSVVGDIGSYPTPTIVGTASLTIDGTNHGADTVTQGAKQDLSTAYNMLANQSPTAPSGAAIGGKTFAPGVYNAAAGIALAGDVTLDGQGDANAVFVFQAGSTLITAASSTVTLIGGAQACNVFWQVGSDATVATDSQFIGNMLVHTSITVQDRATVQGRALAMGGAVTLASNSIDRAECAAPVAARTPAGTSTTSPAPDGSPSPSPSTTTTTTRESTSPESTTSSGSTSSTPTTTSIETPPTTSTTTTPSLPAGGLISPTGAHTAYADGSVLSVYENDGTLSYSGPIDPDATLYWQSGTDKLWVITAGSAELVSETDGIWTHTAVPTTQLPAEIEALI